MGGSPGLVVMGGDSCSKCRGFSSNGHFFTFICRNVGLKRQNINKNWPGIALFLKRLRSYFVRVGSQCDQIGKFGQFLQTFY